MDAQPNMERLSNAVAIASQEIGLVTNLPAFHNGQRIFDAIDRLNTSIDNLSTQVSTLTTQVSALTTRVDTLTTRVDTLTTQVNDKFDNLELRLSANSLNQMARVYNSRISSRETPLRILHDQRNMEIEGFPSDSATLMRLPVATLTRLLDAFQLPTDGNLEMKRKRVREFIGLVADA